MSITLTASMRSNLSSLKVIQSQMDKTQERLSTGKKVNSAIDNASAYYQARSLTNRAADLDSLLDSMGQGVQTIQAANEGIEAITAFVEQMKSIAESAAALDTNATGYDDAIAKYAVQFDAVKSEIADVAKDASYQGVNLLIGNDLKVVFNESRLNDLVVTGKNIVTEMAIKDAVGDEGWKSGVEKITGSITEITTAVEKLRSFATELGNNFTIIETRQNFTEAMVDVLETGADKLVLADMNEESANYLALQTRQQLAINSLALASQSAQSVLSLF